MIVIPDYYHLNFGDAPLPIARIFSNPLVGGVYLKHSQGTNYGDWAPQQVHALRDAGKVPGAYHMLSGPDGTGLEQYRYFRTKYTPQGGDLVLMLDFERSGEGTVVPLDIYRQKGMDFIKAAHADGFEVVLYGHERVVAAWNDWRDSGADYWNSPGDVVHNDAGPKGPDLWQYSPYTTVWGLPNNVSGKVGRDDISKVLTTLPLIGEADMAILTDEQQHYLQGALRYLNAIGAPPADADAKVQEGFTETKARFENATTGPRGPQGDVGPIGPRGPEGPAGTEVPHKHTTPAGQTGGVV